MSSPPSPALQAEALQLVPGAHAYRVWEAWTRRPDKDYNRYLGLELLPENLMFVINVSKHGSWGVGYDTDWHIQSVRKALDRAQEQGVTLYKSTLEAIAAWDSAFHIP